MEDWQIMLAVTAAVFGFILMKAIYDKVTLKQRMRSFFQKIYGKIPENDYDRGRYEYLDFYFKHKAHHGDIIDDITWNDLEMDEIFKLLNQTCTGIGEEYLYAALREPFFEETPLKQREKRIEWFKDHEDERINIQMRLKRLGKMKIWVSISILIICVRRRSTIRH